MSCDINFIIKKGDSEEIISVKDSGLSRGEISYEKIAELVINDKKLKNLLLDYLKFQVNTLEIDTQNIQKDIVHNSIVETLSKKYPDLDWNNVNNNTKLLLVDYFHYYDNNMLGNIIVKRNEKGIIIDKIHVLNPSNYNQVKNLNNYLHAQKLLIDYSQNTREILNEFDLQLIIELFDKILSLSDKKIALPNKPTSIKQLLLDFLDNSDLYAGLHYEKSGSIFSVDNELNDTIKTLLGKKVREATYNDVFVNEIIKRKGNYNSKTKQTPISKKEFELALQVKLKDLSVKNKTNTLEFILINLFLLKENKTDKSYENIIKYLIEKTDDEFSYSFSGIDENYIYLQNVPRTLENIYENFNNKTIELCKFKKEINGFNIYSLNNKFYITKHILTSKTYGKGYNSLEECEKEIASRLKRSLNSESLIELKTKKFRKVIYTPNKYIPGLVIKTLNIELNPDVNLTEEERYLIYNDGIYNKPNDLEEFYQYISNKLFKNISIDTLKKDINTQEKAVTFLYKYRENSKLKYEEIINLFKNSGYKYYIIELVDPPFNSPNGFLKYYKNSGTDKDPRWIAKQVRKTYLTPTNIDIKSKLIEFDDKTNRPKASIEYLTFLANKINDKLGIKINVVTASDLESEEFNSIDKDANGFILDGEIYLNSSNANAKTLLHEYTHILLGILKSINFENYYKLVESVANNSKFKKVKENKIKNYPNLADSDINEEVFADVFANYLLNRDYESFLDNSLILMEDINNKIQSLFGSEVIDEDFFNSDLNYIFNKFSYDLQLKINEKNGLELNFLNHRKVTNWIQQLIALNKKDSEQGIIEIC